MQGKHEVTVKAHLVEGVAVAIHSLYRQEGGPRHVLLQVVESHMTAQKGGGSLSHSGKHTYLKFLAGLMGGHPYLASVVAEMVECLLVEKNVHMRMQCIINASSAQLMETWCQSK